MIAESVVLSLFLLPIMQYEDTNFCLAHGVYFTTSFCHICESYSNTNLHNPLFILPAAIRIILPPSPSPNQAIISPPNYCYLHQQHFVGSFCHLCEQEIIRQTT